ncbi:MAG: S8 family serine peptidase [marine benthic group bacterium]|nr:S8 family serine peptidase [Gemmatimonadota bacterium]
MGWTRLTAVFLACTALALAACTEDVTSPRDAERTAEAPSFSRTQLGDLPNADELGGRYIVVFAGKRGSPRGFETDVEALGGTVDAVYKKVGAAIVSGLSSDAAAELQSRTDVAYAELEPVIDMTPPQLAEPTSAGATPASPGDPTGASFFPIQWHHQAIMAPEAWAAGRLGSAGVTVAILDTGIDYLHADLDGRVDLARSESFVEIDDLYADYFFPGRHFVTDLHYHGTHVASTVSSNAWAAAGVTSQVTLIGVKVCSVFGGCPGSSIVAGIIHAVDNGSDVINMSLGGHFQKSDYPGYVSVINRLFNYARQHRVTVVVSAGNESLDLDHDTNGFKTYCDAPHVICASATAPGYSDDWRYGPFYDVDTPTSYTNYGRSAISVAAPGGDDYGLVLQACSSSSLVIPACQSSPTYVVWVGGTSMSSPHVAGLAALMVEDYGKSPSRVKAAIQKFADDLGQPGTDPFYGKGRINVATAVGAN